MTSMRSEYKWFPGLNSLRFIAASLVVLMHTHLGMKQAGLAILPEFPVLLKGFSAVSFFFVLSGFLITYLLLKEKKYTQTVQIKPFYWRRVFRIWPLYFLVIAFGITFYWKIVPALGLEFTLEYSKALAIFLYSFFAANLLNSLYHVGGILHITWSIAVEEQFYLFWAPLMKHIKNYIPHLILSIILIFYSISVLNAFNVFNLEEGWQMFIRTLQFHYMGFGAAAAYLLFNHHDSLLKLKVFTNKGFQLILLSSIVAYYLFYQKSFWGEVILPIPMGMLYGWLILNISVNPSRIINLENKVADFLGGISYGIYMLHMPVVYGISFLMKSTTSSFQGTSFYFILFYASVFVIIITLAYISSELMEKPINNWGKKWLRGVGTKTERQSLQNPQLQVQ